MNTGSGLRVRRRDGLFGLNISYKHIADEALLLDVYEPSVKRFERAPVFVNIHGGAWSEGSKELTPWVEPIFRALSKEGFVCVSVMYRLVKTWDPDDPVLMRHCVVDCRDSLRFLKKYEAEMGIDAGRIVVFGDSAGGHIAQLLTFSGADSFPGDPALSNYKVNPVAGISWYGPSDLRNLDLFRSEMSEPEHTPEHWGDPITKGEAPLSYERADEAVRKMIDEVSPVTYLQETSAPLLHIHGDQDGLVSAKHAYHLKKHADAVGAPVSLQIVKGAGHGWWKPDIEPDSKTIERMTVQFALDHAGS